MQGGTVQPQPCNHIGVVMSRDARNIFHEITSVVTALDQANRNSALSLTKPRQTVSC